MTANPDFKKKFTSKLELPVFINDELVTFGQTYAKENGYKLDEMGILALYSRIDVMQREDHAVTVAEVKEIMDEAKLSLGKALNDNKTFTESKCKASCKTCIWKIYGFVRSHYSEGRRF